MPQSRVRISGWQGIALVAITYVYFLIFAQFAFLNRLAELGLVDAHLQAVMAAMAAGGIFFSLLTPRLKLCPSPHLRLRIGLVTSGIAAFATMLPLGVASSMAVSFLIGTGLGILTVTLVTHLRQWAGDQHPLLNVGLGTGLGYLICNFPLLFTASPSTQAFTAAALCLVGVSLASQTSKTFIENADELYAPSPLPFAYVLAAFSALVWLDSAAFFIIQSTPLLKAGTWEGTLHLCTNGLLHLLVAVTSAWLLRRRGLSLVLTFSFLALGCACLLILDPSRLLVASVFYPIGVSLYSVALVAYPSLLAPAASVEQRGRQAGWLYAVAGWAASAMGIGMGQHLGHVPAAFVAVAGAVVLLPWLVKIFQLRKREFAFVSALLLASLCLNRFLAEAHDQGQQTSIERGRRVYVSEGCINCHSQYVRPNTADVLLWGPTEPVSQLRLEQPPLIGNRRQGPDLAQVGNRRSPLWLKAHFFDPPEVSGASIMPSFPFLFRDRRGDDLVAYLASLRGAGTQEHLDAERRWKPSASAISSANAHDGEQSFHRHCATCHAVDGKTRDIWRAEFKRLPPDLSVGPFFYLPPSGPSAARIERLAQIAKFGIPGTNMPGHEYLSDDEIASISLWLSQTIAQPHQNP